MLGLKDKAERGKGEGGVGEEVHAPEEMPQMMHHIALRFSGHEILSNGNTLCMTGQMESPQPPPIPHAENSDCIQADNTPLYPVSPAGRRAFSGSS